MVAALYRGDNPRIVLDELLEKYPQAIPNFASVKLLDNLRVCLKI